MCNALFQKHSNDNCANHIVNFLQIALNPVRHHNNPNWFNDKMTELNQVLSFEGLAINASGKVYAVNKATTINEARQRANRLKEL